MTAQIAHHHHLHTHRHRHGSPLLLLFHRSPVPASRHCRTIVAQKKGLPSRKKSGLRTSRDPAQKKLRPPHTTDSSGIYGVWRLFNLEVSAEKDPGKDDYSISEPLLDAITALVGFPISNLPVTALSIVRKSFDARNVINRVKSTEGPRFVYTVDLNLEELDLPSTQLRRLSSHLQNKSGKVEFVGSHVSSTDITTLVKDLQNARGGDNGGKEDTNVSLKLNKSAKVIVVGSGPAGLFSALVLAECGANVTLLEQGQPVEKRGQDIGGLMVRRMLDPESNFCFGEGGAGTWSDGKLTTRIGRNGRSVRTVLETLVKFGAPAQILVDGKPHLGTDKLVKILRQFRSYLQSLGVDIRFGTKMIDLVVQGNRVSGVSINKAVGYQQLDSKKLISDAVVLAVGHSARDVYEKLLGHNITLTPKDFSVGFRVEHPQELINAIQYKKWASEVKKGQGKIPVADYKVTTNVSRDCTDIHNENGHFSCYSFCMCPGGQIVPTSTNTAELCINGMSFSKRSSKWANAALVMPITQLDLEPFVSEHGVLAGIAFQKLLEKDAAVMGGGDLIAPAQVLPDFLEDRISGNSLPSSSYRLGVREAALHNLFSKSLTEQFKIAIVNFNKQLPGFIDRTALLHAVETRTSAPIRIDRSAETFECSSTSGLYPVGEGAGYAGGIVSAAVDGLNAGLSLAEQLGLCKNVFSEWQAAGKFMEY